MLLCDQSVDTRLVFRLVLFLGLIEKPRSTILAKQIPFLTPIVNVYYKEKDKAMVHFVFLFGDYVSHFSVLFPVGTFLETIFP
jgi:hypothetical protein